MFQFQYGSIKSLCIFPSVDNPFRFNSNMVRLRDFQISQYHRRKTFQFQYGSIKSFGRRALKNYLLGFNSNMVRLRD